MNIPEDIDVRFSEGGLTALEQAAVSDGFLRHAQSQDAPEYESKPLKWVCVDRHEGIRAVLTGSILWDWIYVDELWVHPESRDAGMGRALMERMEVYAESLKLEGVWLWTQSWQAEAFYRRLGYQEFSRFENFPKGHSRIGFRKQLASRSEGS